MYLLDTGIVAELRSAASGAGEPGLALWAAGVPRQGLFLSAVSLLEIEAAASRLDRRPREDSGAMRGWIDTQLLPAFEGRVLAIDTAVVRRRAQLAFRDTRDGLIAATALEHGLTLVTRDPAAFRPGKVRTFNPRDYRPTTGGDLDWGQAGRTGPTWLRNLFVRS